MMFSYSLSFPFESFHLRYMTDASTLAGLYVLGSFRRLTTDNSIVLEKKMENPYKAPMAAYGKRRTWIQCLDGHGD